jgi:transcriptional regulator with XRE-family HTH domain
LAGFTYKSYSFVDKDPMIDQVRTIVQESHMTYKAIAEASNVNTQTIRNWLDGGVRKPQAATFNAVLRALGYKLSIRPIDQPELIMFTPPPPKTSVRHVVNMAKYRKGAGVRR